MAGLQPGHQHGAATRPSPSTRRSIDQDYLTSWNNKQAPGYGAPDTDATYTSIYRSQSLDERIKEAIRRKGKIELHDLVNAMEDAGTVDLRGSKVLPYVLKVLIGAASSSSAVLPMAACGVIARGLGRALRRRRPERRRHRRRLATGVRAVRRSTPPPAGDGQRAAPRSTLLRFSCRAAGSCR